MSADQSLECHCGKDGHPLGSVNCPVHGTWRPIETAPKDRTIIITGRYANGRAYVEESYWSPNGHFAARKFDPPTHWMPLPEPFGGWDLESTESAT